jgi:hypothetical protein
MGVRRAVALGPCRASGAEARVAHVVFAPSRVLAVRSPSSCFPTLG